MAVPFALSVHTFINHVGAYVGFASIVGLALLVLLHFAQARETSTLRKRLEESSDRIVSLENRLSQTVRQGQPAVRVVPATPGAPTVTPAPVGARSGSAAVRRVPAPGVALGRSLPGAPAGMAAPALASATRMVTTEAPRPVPAPVPAVAPAPAVVGAPPPGVGAAPAPAGGPASDDTLLVAPATAAAARGNGHDQTAVVPAVAAGQASAAAPPPSPPPPSPPPPSPPPRAQIRPEPARPPRRTAPLPPKRRSLARRLLPVLLAVVVVAVVVAAVLVLRGGGNPNTASAGHHHHTVAPFHPSRVTVAVLNGTDVTHLAKTVATRLHKFGYQKGTVANASVHTQARTIVGYTRGHREAATYIAKALKVSRGSVSPVKPAAISACLAGAPTGGNSCSADVVVTVGHNLAHLAKAAS